MDRWRLHEAMHFREEISHTVIDSVDKMEYCGMMLVMTDQCVRGISCQSTAQYLTPSFVLEGTHGSSEPACLLFLN
eukprot:1161670-Pelagomonas_calceolata.AAC.23